MRSVALGTRLAVLMSVGADHPELRTRPALKRRSCRHRLTLEAAMAEGCEDARISLLIN